MFKITGNTKMFTTTGDFPGVYRISETVRRDLSLVFGNIEMVSTEKLDADNPVECIVFGTYGCGTIVDRFEEAKVVVGKREVYTIFEVHSPVPGISKALVVAGSEKRGTIYGLFKISELVGVSPLVNWSGVLPMEKDKAELLQDGPIVSKEPSVKYRGIFINDEWPAFGNWATKRFGGVNAECYAEVFELILRLKGNYMWPAMWATNFSMDGPGTKSAELADELGIVMSTSHHEPCMRTGEEYRLLRGPESPYGDAWDFLSNRQGIINFWRDGLKRNGKFENVITMGMRGERDTAIMGNATLAENIALLKDVIRTQNTLIKEEVNPDLTKVPRQIVLFTEVEKFYYGDENTPGLIEDPELDGITIMFSDNNHGYTRTLPAKSMLNHKGGYGMYYHVDMHGGSYSYEWIGATYLPRIQDQLTTTYDYGVREIWVVNVGDIATQELEMSFIMDMAYDMDKFGAANRNASEEYIKNWINTQFGGYFNSSEQEKVFDIVSTYTKILERRRHEIMNVDTYHPVHFGETYELIDMCDRVLKECEELLCTCSEKIKTGFYELVYYPAYGSCNLMKAWAVASLNKFYINENRNTGNLLNDVIDKCIEDDEKVVNTLHSIADGKFYGQGLSEHFGFRFWNDNNNQLPLKTYCYPSKNKRLLISKKDETWYLTGREYTQRQQTINDFLNPAVDSIILELSCASREEVSYTIENSCEWLSLSATSGTTKLTDEIVVSVDRSKLSGRQSATIRINGDPEIFADLTFNAQTAEYVREYVGEDNVYVGFNGYTVVEAEHFSAVNNTEDGSYELLSPYGITGSGMKLFPNTLDVTALAGGATPTLEYRIYAEEDGEYEAMFVFAPTTPVTDILDQSFGVSLINSKLPGGTLDMLRVNTVMDTTRPFHGSLQWAIETKDNAKRTVCRLNLKKGVNTIAYCQLSPNLVLERIIVARDLKVIPKSYLGPKESYFTK